MKYFAVRHRNLSLCEICVFWCDSGADLSDADLRGADFSLANVTKVNRGRIVELKTFWI